MRIILLSLLLIATSWALTLHQDQAALIGAYEKVELNSVNRDIDDYIRS